jgi:uroporphyrinogen decarboxylase
MSHHTMSPTERVKAALIGEYVDRVPFCFWHHFKPEGSGIHMAELTIEFFRTKFDLDIVKIMPDLPYPAPEQTITLANQWSSLPDLGLETPMFQQQLICIRELRNQLGSDFPFILTIFSPLTQIFRFVGKARAIAHARENPVAFEQGLATLATNLQLLASAAIETGASGIFFSCQVLEGTKAGWLNIIHVHADPAQEDDEIYFENFTDYPVQVMSWSDRLTGPSLSEALTMTDKCLMGGLAERGPLTHGGETEIENEIMAAVTQTKGRRLILANGCSVPDDTSEEWLHVARKLVDQLR